MKKLLILLLFTSSLFATEKPIKIDYNMTYDFKKLLLSGDNHLPTFDQNGTFIADNYTFYVKVPKESIEMLLNNTHLYGSYGARDDGFGFNPITRFKLLFLKRGKLVTELQVNRFDISPVNDKGSSKYYRPLSEKGTSVCTDYFYRILSISGAMKRANTTEPTLRNKELP